MNDKPVKITRELASELGRHMNMSAPEVYDLAVRAFTCAIFNFDEETLPGSGTMPARTLLTIIKQIPTAAEDDGSGFSVVLPAEVAGEADQAILHRVPVQ